MNLRTIRLSEAAMIAKPNMMKNRAKVTYSGLFSSELSCWRATKSPKPMVVNVTKQ